MSIKNVKTNKDYTLHVVAVDGRTGVFDVRPYLELEAFTDLKKQDAFQKIINGRYFIEWSCGADLSSDTIKAQLKNVQQITAPDARTSRR